MRCLFYFECSFDESLEKPMFNTYYGPVIKEDDKTVIIENNAENGNVNHKTHLSKIALGKANNNYSSDMINSKS